MTAHVIPLMGRLRTPDGEAERMGSCGDIVNVQVQMQSGRISHAVFVAQGCAATMACASAACALARGKTAGEARIEVTPERVREILGGLPSDHEHCSVLAVNALRGAVEDAVLTSRDDWRRLYRVDRH
jgi:nitrogen fixation NifU-like protein